MKEKLKNPAVLIITMMVLINAGLFFYFDYRSNTSDDQIKATITSAEQERKQRTDQNCELFERLHKKDVDDLKGTYKYLRQQPRDELLVGINRFIVAALPEAETKAQIDIAPSYCDQPHLGLPEPDPVVPQRPAFLNKYLPSPPGQNENLQNLTNK